MNTLHQTMSKFSKEHASTFNFSIQNGTHTDWASSSLCLSKEEKTSLRTTQTELLLVKMMMMMNCQKLNKVLWKYKNKSLHLWRLLKLMIFLDFWVNQLLSNKQLFNQLKVIIHLMTSLEHRVWPKFQSSKLNRFLFHQIHLMIYLEVEWVNSNLSWVCNHQFNQFKWNHYLSIQFSTLPQPICLLKILLHNLLLTWCLAELQCQWDQRRLCWMLTKILNLKSISNWQEIPKITQFIKSRLFIQTKLVD